MVPDQPPDSTSGGADRLAPMRRVLSFVVVLALAAGGCFVPRDADVGPGLDGLYVVNGTDPVGVDYSGTVQIGATDQPNVYSIEWLVTGGIQQGTGTLSGDVFAGTWSGLGRERGTGTSGTFRYTVGTDHVLRGTRTVDGVEGEAVEEILPGN